MRSAGAAALLTSFGFSLQSCSDDDDVTPSNPGTGGGGGTGGGSDDDVIFTFSLDSSPFDALQTEDAWVLHPDEDYLLLNVGGSIRALTSVCTHSGCARDWSFSGKEAQCTCHGSVFDQDGNVVQGPANGALQEFVVEIEDNTVTVKR